jgi:hypothetical protein
VAFFEKVNFNGNSLHNYFLSEILLNQLGKC